MLTCADLGTQGHLVEPLLPSGRLQDIDFAAAPSGSLKKYSKAIKRNHEAMQRWRRAMATSHRAVPALDNLFQDAEDWLEEDSVMREVLPMAVEKAVAGATQKRTELQERAVQLLEQITSSMVDAEELAVIPSPPLSAIILSYRMYQHYCMYPDNKFYYVLILWSSKMETLSMSQNIFSP